MPSPSPLRRFFPALGLAMILLSVGVAMGAQPLLPREWRPAWPALILGLGNGVALVLLLGRARRRPDERTGFRLLAASLLPAIGSNLVLARTAPADWQSLEGYVGLFAALQMLSIFFQVLAVALLPWRTPDRPSSRAERVLAGLCSLLFALSLLMLLGSIGPWRGAILPGSLAILLATSLRSAILGGVLAFKVAQRPARIQGPVFWLLVLTALSAFITSAAHLAGPGLLQRMAAAPSGVVIALPAALAMAALDPRALEPAGDQGWTPWAAYTLLLVPFFGGTLAFLALRGAFPTPLPLSLAVFLLQSACLCLLLVLALGEVQAANSRLDARVRERTRTLEAMQALALRTERLNLSAVLGSGAIRTLDGFHSAISADLDLLALAQARGASPDPAVLDRLCFTADRASRLTRNLLATSRTGAVEEPLTDLAQVLGNLAPWLRELMPTAIRLELSEPGMPVPVRLPAPQAEQILFNLVVNALEALDGQGTLQVGLMAYEGCAVLSVGDTGPGIPPGIRDRIFEPLFTTKPHGTGLGLASVKGHVERAGGTVSLESATGRGSCFYVALPLAA